MSELLSYQIAPIEPDEWNMVLSGWKRSYREALPQMRTGDFYVFQGAVIDQILSRWPTVLVARNPDGVALGWICCEATPEAFILHFCNVKQAYRRQGVAKALLSAALDALPDAGDKLLITHRTRHFGTAARMGFESCPVGRFLAENPV